jgi:cytochrome P450
VAAAAPRHPVTFRRDRIADFAGLIVDEADALVKRLEAKVDAGPVNVVQEMTRLTLGVLGKTLLNADLSAFLSLGEEFEVAQDQAMFEMVTLQMLPIWLPIPRHRRFHAALGQLESAAMALVDEREKGAGVGSDDMITRLLNAYKDEPDENLRRRRLRDELLTILLAGHETTASTLSWAWYLIDKNPEVGERLRAEAAEVLGDRLPAGR